MHHTKLIGALLLVACSGGIAQPIDIEIKGIRIGMTKAELHQLHSDLKGFTVAGVRSKYEHVPLGLRYRDDLLDQVAFYFHSTGFRQVLEALKEKYPTLACETNNVSNAMGATFEQQKCSLEDANSVLHLSRFVNDTRTSGLTLMSKKSLQEQIDKSKAQKKDI